MSQFATLLPRAFVLVVALTLATASGLAQTGENSARRPRLLEVPDGPYVSVPKEGRRTSPRYTASSPGYFAAQVNVDDSSRNILDDAANEPSLAVDPRDPSRIAMGWRQFDTRFNSFRQAGYAYSTDAGHTWTFPGVIEPGIFRSDPVLDSDSYGTFYYNSLTNSPTFFCTVFRSGDGGAGWDAGVFAWGGDKQWMTIDQSGGIGDGNIYADWTSYYSYCYPDFFTRSSDLGEGYEPCETIPEDPYWGTLDVGPDGELYVGAAAGTSNGFVVAKSTTARDSLQAVTWDLATHVSLNGEIVGFGGYSCPNPTGLLGQTQVAVDRSAGSTRGNVYLLCSVDPTTGTDPLDVMFARSTNGGQTWSAPQRVNDDSATNAWQWFGTMSVAPDGRIDVAWLDTRDDPGGLGSSLYYSFSTDGGVTWSINERLSESFDPHVGWPQQDKMGDYFDMVSDSTGAHLAWAGTFNGEQDVYYAHISPVTTGIAGGNTGLPSSFALRQNYPNPFNPATTFSFSLPVQEHVTVKVYDLLGREVATIVSEMLEAGDHSRVWDASGLASGAYFYKMTAGGFTASRRLMLLR